jgi:hypothetical protein
MINKINKEWRRSMNASLIYSFLVKFAPLVLQCPFEIDKRVYLSHLQPTPQIPKSIGAASGDFGIHSSEEWL